MVRVKYVGDVKRNFQWNSMGKVFNYRLSPGETIKVPKEQVMYLLSYGCFTTQSEPVKSPETPTVINISKMVKEERAPEIKVEVVAEVITPVVVEEPVVSEPVVKVEEVVEVVQPEPVKKKIDYLQFNKKMLQKRCKDAGLDTKGNKDDLIARLVVNDQQN